MSSNTSLSALITLTSVLIALKASTSDSLSLKRDLRHFIFGVDLGLASLKGNLGHFVFGLDFGLVLSLKGVLRHFVFGVSLCTGLMEVDQDLDVFVSCLN